MKIIKIRQSQVLIQIKDFYLLEHLKWEIWDNFFEFVRNNSKVFKHFTRDICDCCEGKVFSCILYIDMDNTIIKTKIWDWGNGEWRWYLYTNDFLIIGAFLDTMTVLLKQHFSQESFMKDKLITLEEGVI